MAHERETWLNHGVAELLLRGRPVETADEHAQAQADRLAGVLAEAVDGGADAGSGELPGEAAALAAFRQAVGTAGRTVSRSKGVVAASAADADGIGTVRLGPEPRRVRLPSFGRPIRLGVAAAMAGCALSGVAAGAGYLYAPSAGESSPRPSNSASGAVTPEPLVSESPSPGVSRPPPLPGESPESDAGSVVPGATGSHSTAGAGGGPKGGQDKDESGKGRTSGDGWKSGDGEKWYAKLVQACQEYRNGTIAVGKKKQLEEAARGPAGVKRFCDGLLSGSSGGDGHYGGVPGDDGGGTGGDDGDDGGGGSGGGDGPQHGGPADGGGTDGGIGGGSDGGTDIGGTDVGGTDGGGTDGGSGPPPTDWPGGDSGDSGETVAPSSQPPVTPDDGTNSGTDQATP
ncbi:hypothetical protein [Streptomyces sp. NPDC058665]|uniref:hypothetical protein n=1 Tax=Streptomyces sp. NPDC058665 TaxID=3346586 RepID=UPI00365209F8